MKKVTLMLTGSCNLKCSYCYERKKQGRRMEFKTAKDIIDREMKGVPDPDAPVEFVLFGGEPFLEFPLLRDIVQYVREVYHDKNVLLSTVTNGTLVHGEIKKWLKEHAEDFICVLSYDGTPQMQDRNRSCSSSLVDLAFFRDLYETPTIKMTVSEETLPSLAEGVLYCAKNGFAVNCGLAYGIEWEEEGLAGQLKEQLEILDRAYLGDRSLKKCSLLEFPYEDIYHSKNKRYRLCDAGDGACAYDTEGKRYPCHMFLPCCLPEGKEASFPEPVFPQLEVCAECLPEKCRSCVIASVCPMCYASNYMESGNIYAASGAVCLYSRVLFLNKVLYWAQCWRRGFLTLKEEEEQMLLDSIMRVQDLSDGAL